MTPSGEKANHVISGKAWIPETESEKLEVREQLDRILSSALFRHSKRYPALLRYVVERLIDGHTDFVKERTLGIEVFHRDPDYDTNQDPVVRTTAVEVRRRLTQYYQEVGHESELRIEFPLGSYTPEFRLPAAPVGVAIPMPVPILVPPPAEPREAPHRPRAWQTRQKAIAAGLVTVAASAVFAAFWWRSESPLDRFWAPIWTSAAPALICVEASGEESAAANAGVQQASTAFGTEQPIPFHDMTSVARIMWLRPSSARTFRIRSESGTKFEDLREGPAVLVGGFGNRWTMRLLGQPNLRFRLNREGTLAWIGDREDPSRRTWSIQLDGTGARPVEDFALVSRVRDPSTGQFAVVAAGLTPVGTGAAAELISTSQYLDEAMRNAPKGWSNMGLQVVLATRLTAGNPGPPRILATHFW
jgi:hypothetical protein